LNDLHHRLDDKRAIAAKLRQEHKRRSDVLGESRERSLMRQIHAYDDYIQRTQKKIDHLSQSYNEGQWERVAQPIIATADHSSQEILTKSARRFSIGLYLCCLARDDCLTIQRHQ
jgi:hypothetical protein